MANLLTTTCVYGNEWACATYAAIGDDWQWHPTETEEERRDRTIREQQAEEERRKATERSLEILLSNLSEWEIRYFNTHKCIPIRDPKGRYIKYEIMVGTSVNIVEYNHKEQKIRKLCFGPRGNLPVYDHMLAQKVSLETIERIALKTANSFEV